MVETVFTDEDKRNLKTLAEELPKLRSLVEEFIETMEILGDEKLLKSIAAGLKDLKEGRVVGYKELLAELKLDEKKFELVFTIEFLKRLKNLDKADQIRILRNLRILEDHPFAGKRLAGRLSEVMLFRVGEYRVIHQVSKKKIIIRTVGHRKQAYQK